VADGSHLGQGKGHALEGEGEWRADEREDKGQDAEGGGDPAADGGDVGDDLGPVLLGPAKRGIGGGSDVVPQAGLVLQPVAAEGGPDGRGGAGGRGVPRGDCLCEPAVGKVGSVCKART
jgi:hypothetical protein